MFAVRAVGGMSNNDSENTVKKKAAIMSLLSRLFKKKKAIVENENADADELDIQVARYKPESLENLCKNTKFSKKELQIMYRGFKQECPSGIVNEDTFKQIYSQFFPQGDSNAYAHFVFNAFDKDKNGSISFEEFVRALSMLCRGSMEEKLNWAFTLYDINGDGVITKDEFTEIVTSIYDMMGKCTDPAVDECAVLEHVNAIYQRGDYGEDDALSMEQFIELCNRDQCMLQPSFLVFDTDLRLGDY